MKDNAVLLAKKIATPLVENMKVWIEYAAIIVENYGEQIKLGIKLAFVMVGLAVEAR